MKTFVMGRKAENIVASMFKEAGFKVIPYGYEHTVPELADKNNVIVGKAAEYIRHQPDFIVVNEKNEAFFIEVKFRKQGKLVDKELFPYPNCYVVLLTKDLIMAQSTHYLFKKGVNFLMLTKMPPFKSIPQPLIQKTLQKLRRELGDETRTKQIIGNIVEKATGKTLQSPKATFGKFVNSKKRKGKSKIKMPKRRWAYRRKRK